MENKNTFFIPLPLIVLDSIGAILLALGFAKRFANVDILPANLLFENYATHFMIVGVLLMLPAIFNIFGKIRGIKSRDYNGQ